MGQPADRAGYEALRTSFRWDLPTEYDIAWATVGRTLTPDATALVHTDLAGRVQQYSYAALDRASNALAGALVDAGVTPGDRVAVSFPQSPECLMAHLASLKVGAVVVPLSMIAGTDAVEHMLSDARVGGVLADAGQRDRIGDDAADLTMFVTTGTAEAPLPALGGFADHVPDDGSVEPHRGSIAEPAMILYTSGSTGPPKGVVQSHGYLPGSLPGYQLCFELFGADELRNARVYTPAEWAWAGALFDVVFPTLAVGGTVVSRERRTGFEPTRCLAVLADRSVTHTFLPPTALRRIREIAPDGTSLPDLAVIHCGGEPLPADLRRWAEDAFSVTVNQGYGQTEANAILATCSLAYGTPPEATGRVVPGHEVAIDVDGTIRHDAGASGELLIGTPDPVVMSGYWNDAAATEDALIRDDWLRTGDRATLLEGGAVRIEGRLDDVILTSGYRVGSAEVEAALERHPAVERAIVDGIPDPRRGTIVKAAVLIREPAAPSGELRDDLREFVGDRLGAYKKPREIEFIADLPITERGKIDRDALF